STAESSRNIGGGEANGTVTFSGSGVPPLGAACAATSFSLSGSSAAFTLNTVGTEFAGPVTIAGNGGSSCESASQGGGNLTLTQVQGSGPSGSSIDCGNPAVGARAQPSAFTSCSTD